MILQNCKDEEMEEMASQQGPGEQKSQVGDRGGDCLQADGTTEQR